MTINPELFTRRVGLFSIFAMIITGIIGIYGWITGDYLTFDMSNLTPIAPVAAIAYALLGAILLTFILPLKSKYANLTAKIFVLLILVIGCMFWMAAVFFPSLDIQELFLTPLIGDASKIDNPIAPLAALGIFLGAVALVMMIFKRIKWRHLDNAIGLLGLSVFSMGSLSLIGYAFGTPQFFGHSVKAVSLSSSFALIFFGIGIIALNGTSKWPLSVFSSNTVSAQGLRISIPMAMATFLVFSWVLFRVIIPSSSDPVPAVAIFTTAATAMAAYSIWFTSGKVQTQVDKAQKDRIDAMDALIKANNKLDILDSLTRHDVMNQISAAILEAQIMKGANKEPQIRQSAENIEKIGATIIDMLRFSKEYRHIGVESPKWMEVKALFSVVVGQLDMTKCKVLCSYCTEWRVFADPMLVKAFFNIIENSMRHGGNVTNVTVECIPQNDDGTLRIIFSDNGTGIPEAEKEIIFQKGVGKNTGLGLFLVREILSITGLSIKENGIPGQGARFEITVPKGKFEAMSQPERTME